MLQYENDSEMFHMVSIKCGISLNWMPPRTSFIHTICYVYLVNFQANMNILTSLDPRCCG